MRKRAVFHGLWLLLFSPPVPLHAWSKDLHLEIYRAASRLSPIVGNRVDEEAFRDAIVTGVTEPDQLDKSCSHHCVTSKRPEAYTIAAGLLAKIRNPSLIWTPRQRAQAIGQYLHYVADCITPPVAIVRDQVDMPFDLAVYRERRPLAEPLSESLKALQAAAYRSEPGLQTLPLSFRDAVNLTIEAALLLPARPSATPVEDKGPVLLAPITIVSMASEARTHWEETPRILHNGIHVLEWTTRPSGDTTIVRALIYNNLDFCVRHVLFWSKGWVGGLTTSLPSYSLRVVELPGPPRSPDEVITRFIPGEACPEDPERPSIPVAWRGIVAAERGVPHFDRVREIRPGDPAPPPVGRTTYLEYLKSDLEAIGGLEIPTFQVTAGESRVDFRIELTNRSEKSPRPLQLELQTGSIKERYSEVKELTFDVSGLKVGASKTFQGFIEATTFGENTAVRVFRIRRAEPKTVAPTPVAKKQLKW